MADREGTEHEGREPKRRYVYDEMSYYCEEGHELGYEELAAADAITVEEAREEYTDLDALDAALALADHDLSEEVDALGGYFGGRGSEMSNAASPCAGGPIIVSGFIERWDGTSHGKAVYDDLASALDTSPSRFGRDNVFADCEISRIWDENGSLFVEGHHHDGAVRVEVRQLSDEGLASYEAISDAWVGEPFTANGRSYDGSDRSVSQAMFDLWEATEPPRYMERAFGCPAEEWVDPPQNEPLAEQAIEAAGATATARSPYRGSDRAR